MILDQGAKMSRKKGGLLFEFIDTSSMRMCNARMGIDTKKYHSKFNLEKQTLENCALCEENA